MISCQFDDGETSACIVLRPNRSWTWRANVYFIGSLMAVSLTMAAVFSARGFWMILPFTVLEISVLTACLYYCVRRTHTTEVLRLNRDALIFERGIRRPVLHLELERYFTRFFVRPAHHPWYKKRIELKCRDRALEVGEFLSDDEKDELVRDLRQIIHRLDSLPPTAC